MWYNLTYDRLQYCEMQKSVPFLVTFSEGGENGGSRPADEQVCIVFAIGQVLKFFLWQENLPHFLR